jgi:hypothetical protein
VKVGCATSITTNRVALTRALSSALAVTLASIVVALLALPAGAAAKQGGGPLDRLTTQQCAQERLDLGKKAFRKRYGAKHTMRNCVRRNRAQVSSAAQSAGQDCQSELAAEGVETFIDEYGDDPTDSLDYAMSECISEGIDELLNPDTGDPEIDDEPA